jgi:hypothetical protein
VSKQFKMNQHHHQASSLIAALPDVKALYVHSLPASFFQEGGSLAAMESSTQEAVAALVYAYPPVPMSGDNGDGDGDADAAARHLAKYMAFAEQHAKISHFDNNVTRGGYGGSGGGENELCERLVYRYPTSGAATAGVAAANAAGAWIVHQVVAERRWLVTWVLGADAVWSAYAHLCTNKNRNNDFLLAIQQASSSSS